MSSVNSKGEILSDYNNNFEAKFEIDVEDSIATRVERHIKERKWELSTDGKVKLKEGDAFNDVYEFKKVLKYYVI